MTVAKVMNIISRLPGCSGQAADAVPAHTQVRLEDAPTFLIPNSECPGIWIRPPKHKWPKSWSRKEDPVVPREWNLYCHPLAGQLFFWNTVGKSFLNGNVLSTVNDDSSYPRMWTLSNWQATETTHRTDLDNLWKTSTWENQHHFLTMYFSVTLEESQISRCIVANCKDMFESRISAGATKRLPTRALGKCFVETISSWSFDMESHTKNNWAILQSRVTMHGWPSIWRICKNSQFSTCDRMNIVCILHIDIVHSLFAQCSLRMCTNDLDRMGLSLQSCFHWNKCH